MLRVTASANLNSWLHKEPLIPCDHSINGSMRFMPTNAA